MRPEIAFVVALDRVGHSPWSIERKVLLSEELAQVVQSSSAYLAVAGRVLTLDSGDAALVFFRRPACRNSRGAVIHTRHVICDVRSGQ